ncbi:hypothetical protein HDU77_005859 [Chytriomyces hyalinus]|nr:hypothetical protein HDU77_005859 [Chytriomyces hyalinus]
MSANPKPLTVFVAVAERRTIIVTIPKDATVADLKSAVHNQQGDSMEGAVVSTGTKVWKDDDKLFDMDGASSNVIKVAISIPESQKQAAKKKPSVRIGRVGNESSCATCTNASTNRCMTCGKLFCKTCMDAGDGHSPAQVEEASDKKKRVTFSVSMECKRCASEIESPQLFERSAGKWKQNRWYILLVVALVIIAAIVLNVSPPKAAPKH